MHLFPYIKISILKHEINDIEILYKEKDYVKRKFKEGMAIKKYYAII